MLPPVDTATLTACPKFDALYNDLCKNKLNEDGTSILYPKERTEIFEQLQNVRAQKARRQIVLSELHTLDFSDDDLPDELRQLAGIVAALLSGQVAKDDADLLEDELSRLKHNSPALGTALSRQFQSNASALAQVISTTESVTIDALPAQLRQQLEEASRLRSRLGQVRLVQAQTVLSIHMLHRQVMENSIRILEQTIHGAVARGTKAKADYLSVVAEGMSKKLAVQHGQLMQQLYSPGMQEALRAKMAEVEEEDRLMRRKIREAEQPLAEYQSIRGIKEVAKEFAEILRETEKVGEEISRLEEHET